MSKETAREVQIEFDQLAYAGNLNGMGQAWLDRMARLSKRVRELLDPEDAPYYTLTAEDVGQPTITAWGRKWSVSSFIGRVLGPGKAQDGSDHPGDVGKRVYRVPTAVDNEWILQVENDSQFYARKSREAKREAVIEAGKAAAAHQLDRDWPDTSHVRRHLIDVPESEQL